MKTVFSLSICTCFRLIFQIRINIFSKHHINLVTNMLPFDNDSILMLALAYDVKTLGCSYLYSIRKKNNLFFPLVLPPSSTLFLKKSLLGNTAGFGYKWQNEWIFVILIQSCWQQYKAVHTSDWLVWHFSPMAYHDWCSHLWRCLKQIPENHPVFPQQFICLWLHWIAVLATPKAPGLPRSRRWFRKVWFWACAQYSAPWLAT